MLKRILVPLDGSGRAEAALPVAARLARAGQGTLILLRVYDAISSELVALEETADAREATTYLEQVASWPELAGIPTEHAALAGNATLTLLDAVALFQIDLIVLASHGRSGLPRWALGSVAGTVARSAPVPVLVLRERSGVRLALRLAREEPIEALVALDGSAWAEAALAPAAAVIQALAAPGEGALHLVQVVPPVTGAHPSPPPPLPHPDDRQEQAIQEAQSYLGGVVARLHTAPTPAPPLAVTWSAPVAAEVATTLLRLAEQGKRQHPVESEKPPRQTVLLVLATHGRGGPPRWALGRTAEQVLERAELPLLLVRPPEVLPFPP
jgi:nucleotide-binding universal stress UspA family protein